MIGESRFPYEQIYYNFHKDRRRGEYIYRYFLRTDTTSRASRATRKKSQ